MKTLLFFNAMGGAGKTTLVQHVAWMFSEQGERVLVADLDPQLFLTARFLDDDQIAVLLDADGPVTIGQALSPVLDGTGQIADPAVINITDHLALLPGDPVLSLFEDTLAAGWHLYGTGIYHRRSTTALANILLNAGKRWRADWLLIDLGPNFGALNRAVAIAADYVVVPAVPSRFALRGLENMGTRLNDWRSQWHKLSGQWPDEHAEQPAGTMQPIGYIVTRLTSWHGQPPKSARPWIDQIPAAYRRTIAPHVPLPLPGEPDPCCLALLKDYRTLAAYAEEARKPMFYLTPADGAIGSHQAAVRQCYTEFRGLVRHISAAIDMKPPRS